MSSKKKQTTNAKIKMQKLGGSLLVITIVAGGLALGANLFLCFIYKAPPFARPDDGRCISLISPAGGMSPSRLLRTISYPASLILNDLGRASTAGPVMKPDDCTCSFPDFFSMSSEDVLASPTILCSKLRLYEFFAASSPLLTAVREPEDLRTFVAFSIYCVLQALVKICFNSELG